MRTRIGLHVLHDRVALDDLLAAQLTLPRPDLRLQPDPHPGTFVHPRLAFGTNRDLKGSTWTTKKPSRRPQQTPRRLCCDEDTRASGGQWMMAPRSRAGRSTPTTTERRSCQPRAVTTGRSLGKLSQDPRHRWHLLGLQRFIRREFKPWFADTKDREPPPDPVLLIRRLPGETVF